MCFSDPWCVASILQVTKCPLDHWPSRASSRQQKVGRGGREVFSRVTPTRRHCSPRPEGAWGVSAPRRARPSHGAPSPDGGGQRTGRRLAASAGTAFNSFLERSQSFRPVACHGRLEGERGDRVQGAGAGGALTGVALRPAPGTLLPTRRQNCSLKVRSLRCPLWPAPTLEGIALKSESVCGTQASPGECGSCWGLRLETGGPVLPSDGPRRV